jgi:hypothetical protein
VLYGDGTGHFPQATSVTATVPAGSTGTDYVNFSAGDVNSDGASDIMATHNQITNDRIFVFYGDSTRKFLKQASPRIGRCIGGPAQTADMDGNGINDLIVDETDCANPSVGVQFVDVLTRNPNSSYNPDQTVYWAQPVNGVVYPIQMPPLVVRANLDSKPDLVTVQCADDHCFSQYTTTQLNTTVGNFPTCSAPVATGINVCSPPAGTPVASPVSFAVGASGTVPMRDVEVWIDGAKRAEQIDGFSRYTFLNSSVTLNPGTHSVTVFGAGWDQSLVSKSFTVSVQ